MPFFSMRPKKIGLDYFPLDCLPDEKLRGLDTLQGNDGFTWIIKFWQCAYQTDSGEVDIRGLFGEVFAKNCRITTTKQNEIIETCINLGLLYKTDSGRLTSHGIKKRIEIVYQIRKNAIERHTRKEIKVKEIKVKEIKVKESKRITNNPSNSENNSSYSENNSIKEEKPNVIPPSLDSVFAYCRERKNKVNVPLWFDFYTSKGWMIGKNRMRDWKAAVRTWEQKDGQPPRIDYAEGRRLAAEEINIDAKRKRGEGRGLKANAEPAPVGETLQEMMANLPWNKK